MVSFLFAAIYFRTYLALFDLFDAGLYVWSFLEEKSRVRQESKITMNRKVGGTKIRESPVLTNGTKEQQQFSTTLFIHDKGQRQKLKKNNTDKVVWDIEDRNLIQTRELSNCLSTMSRSGKDRCVVPNEIHHGFGIHVG